MAVCPSSRRFFKTGGNEMELTMNTRREIIKKMAPEYQKAKKKEKRFEMNSSTSPDTPGLMPPGYLTERNGKKLILVGSIKKIKRNRKKIYDEEVLSSLKKIWFSFDCPSGKRLNLTVPGTQLLTHFLIYFLYTKWYPTLNILRISPLLEIYFL